MAYLAVQRIRYLILSYLIRKGNHSVLWGQASAGDVKQESMRVIHVQRKPRAHVGTRRGGQGRSSVGRWRRRARGTGTRSVHACTCTSRHHSAPRNARIGHARSSSTGPHPRWLRQPSHARPGLELASSVATSEITRPTWPTFQFVCAPPPPSRRQDRGNPREHRGRWALGLGVTRHSTAASLIWTSRGSKMQFF